MKLQVEDITEDDFCEYLAVRDSGVTNMFDVRMVSELSGLEREKITLIMQNFEMLSDKYGEAICQD